MNVGAGSAPAEYSTLEPHTWRKTVDRLLRLVTRLVVPSTEARAAINHAADAVRPGQRHLDSWYSTYVQDHADRLAVDLEIVASLDPERSCAILDIGSVPPILLSALASEKRHACGVDIAPERFPIDEPRVARCDIEQEPLPFPDEEFDIVLLNEVFEHLRLDLLRVGNELRRILRPGGALALSTPNARSHRGIFSFLIRGQTGWCGAQDVHGQFDKLASLGHMGHIREYTATDVTRLFGHFDFSLDRVIWRGRDSSSLLRVADRIVPPLSPFMSLIFVKEPSSTIHQFAPSQ